MKYYHYWSLISLCAAVFENFIVKGTVVDADEDDVVIGDEVVVEAQLIPDSKQYSTVKLQFTIRLSRVRLVFDCNYVVILI